MRILILSGGHPYLTRAEIIDFLQQAIRLIGW